MTDQFKKEEIRGIVYGNGSFWGKGTTVPVFELDLFSV